MGKQIMVTEELYEKLEGMKKGQKSSFTKVIESMLKKRTPRQKLNAAITELESVATDVIAHNGLENTFSVLRVVLLHCLANPETTEAVTAELEKIYKNISKKGK